MCMAIFKPADKLLTKRAAKNSFDGNKHGAGYAYAKDGKLVVEKGFFSFAKFWKAFNAIQKGNPCLVHFRWATHGKIDAANCHPFIVTNGVAMVHNGIFSDFGGTKRSDTAEFTKCVLTPMFKSAPDAWKLPAYQYMLEKTVGVGNKVIILNALGEHLIVREFAGIWDKGIWYSNSGYTSWASDDDTGVALPSSYSGSLTNLPANPIDWKKPIDWHPRNETERILGAPSRLTHTQGYKQGDLLNSRDYDAELERSRKHDTEVALEVLRNAPMTAIELPLDDELLPSSLI